jgi:hypothetical protein
MTDAWLKASGLRRKAFMRDPRNYSPRIRDDAIRTYAPGRTFIDVGGMWTLDGRDSFFAEEAGATQVTLLDILKTDGFTKRLEQGDTKVRFVQGDLHDPATRAAAGPHDVVWSSGLLYHVPDPLHTIRCLGELAKELLIIQTYTIPEIPGIPNGAVYWPGLDEGSRSRYAAAYERQAGRGERVGLTSEFAPEAAYDNWWWGMSASAISSMLTTTVGTVVESVGHDLFRRFVVRVR